jgi:hypothetical protein
MYTGPNLGEQYKNYVKTVLNDGGFYSFPNARDFQPDFENALNQNPLLLMLPNSGKLSKLYSVLPEDGSGDFTVVRNGTARYFDKDGLLKTAPANTPRFEFNPLNRQYRGLLVENSTTNLITRSENFNLDPWGTSGTIVRTGNQTIAPNGTLTGTEVQFSIGGNLRTTQQSISSNVRYTFSCFYKNKNLTSSQNFRLSISNQRTAPNDFSVFTTINLVNGTVSTPTVSGTIGTGYLQNSELSGIENVGNGWYRVFLSIVSGTASSFAFGLIAIASTPTNNNMELYIWGAQLETNINPTSYIFTQGSQVTRPADVITVTVPTGVTEVKYVLNDTFTTELVTAGDIFTLPNGRITQLYMI